MKNLLYCFLFVLIGCNPPLNEDKEETPQKAATLITGNINVQRLQENFSLYKKLQMASDTSTTKSTLYYKGRKEIPKHGILVVTNKNKDTLLTYFGDVKTIRRTYTFKKGNRYFIQFARESGNYPHQFKYTRFYAIDTIKRSFYETKALRTDAIESLFFLRFKDSVPLQPIEYQQTGPNDFTISAAYFKDSLDFKIKYEASALLEFEGHDNDSIALSANPTEITTSLTSDAYSSSTIQLDKYIGEIDGYDLLYNCKNCISSYSESISVFAKKDTIKIKLFDYYKFGGNYLDGISLRYFNNHPFIYIHSTHTYGHSLGDLYALDLENLKVNYVNKIEHNLKIPDSIYMRNFSGVEIDSSGDFTFGASYRNLSGGGKGGYLSGNYHLIHVKGNIYLLEPINVKLSSNSE